MRQIHKLNFDISGIDLPILFLHVSNLDGLMNTRHIFPLMIFSAVSGDHEILHFISCFFSLTNPKGAIMETRMYVPTFVPCHIILGFVTFLNVYKCF